MDLSRTISGGAEDNVGIPDDLRCKRSDGKQWRCTAMSMPDKTVCEKHYIQAKKRAANSAMRASIKKAKRKYDGDTEIYLESKSDDMDVPLNSQFGEVSGFSGKKKKEKEAKGQTVYSPEVAPVRSFSGRSSLRSTDDMDKDESDHEVSRRSYRTPPPAAVDSDRCRSQKTLEISPVTETSSGTSESSDDTGGQPCHQCRSNSQGGVIWCLKCDRRGYCENCVSTCYPGINMEEIERNCPACRGICSCRMCMRGDNLLKARIREISAKEKLEFLYFLLSAVLPIVKRVHLEQSSEVDLEKKFRGSDIDLPRTKLNADEQMCCDFCRVPIIDYHRHCANCSYDLCLSCCKDIREASNLATKNETDDIPHVSDDNSNKMIFSHIKLSDVQLKTFEKLTDWKANEDESIPCPPEVHGGCGSSILTLKRIFKMNWVAKLVKNADEMVSGCKMRNPSESSHTGSFFTAFQDSGKDGENDDNVLFQLSLHDLKKEGIKDFRVHWSRGKPVIVNEVVDTSSSVAWDPLSIWSGIKETTEEKMKDPNRKVKAVDCKSLSEINIGLEDFINGYYEGRLDENGEHQMLKLKDWPTPSSSEEFLLYQRPEFISRLPLLQFIHSKWGLLNVAAKLPHYSLQNDVGPKILISYGNGKDTGESDSLDNLHINMRDMVFLLLHVHEPNPKAAQSTLTETHNILEESATKEESVPPEMLLSSAKSLEFSTDGSCNADIHTSDDEEKGSRVIQENGDEEKNIDYPEKRFTTQEGMETAPTGAFWDVFCREDVPKLMNYISIHKEELRMPDRVIDNHVPRPLYDGVVYLNEHHQRKLKEEFGVEPWSFEQRLGDAIFIPAGCPFQVRHIQSSVQLGLDFLSPESLAEALRLSEDIRGLPNGHDAKLHVLEVRKISLYAASSSIKEVQKLVLDPKLGPELGFEDPNLTSLVSQNLANIVKRRQISCS